jgi:hypothetical protein
MKLTLEDFSVGETVNVKALHDDIFCDFTGTIKDTHGDYIVVEDQDGDCWDCEPGQLSHNTDQYMH